MSSDDQLVTFAAAIEAAAVTTLAALFAGRLVTSAPTPVGSLAAATLSSHRACRDALNALASVPVLVAPDEVVARLGLNSADDAKSLADVFAIAMKVDDLLSQTCVAATSQVGDPLLRSLLAQVATVAGHRLGALRTLAAIPPDELSLALGPPIHPTLLSADVGSAVTASFVGTDNALSPGNP